ncbi:MAG: hypothetical protein IJ844_09725 [Prevotella sp.]|nr:hypothetical protein [Prevotella sp.]
MEDLVLSIPVQDAAFIETLAQRMGWTMRKRRTSVERFIRSAALDHRSLATEGTQEGRSQGENLCPKSPQMTDEEIQAEINAVRYGE